MIPKEGVVNLMGIFIQCWKRVSKPYAWVKKNKTHLCGPDACAFGNDHVKKDFRLGFD